jgi:hypothetical protein
MYFHASRSYPSVLVPVALTFIVSIPLWLVTYPPLYDYPFHLARLLVLDDIFSGGPLSKYYEINSLIIPNVAMDMIGIGLQKFLDIENAGQAFLIITIFLTISGAGFLNRTLFGRSGFAPGLVAALTFNWVFSSGFVNYLFALSLLPWSVGIFIRLRHGSAGLRLACGVLVCFALFFSHLVVFGFYVVVIASLEMQWGVPLLRTQPMAVVGRSIIAGLPVLAVFALFLIRSPTAHAAGAPITYDGFQSILGFVRYKSLWPVRALSSGDALADWGSIAGAAGIALLVARVGSVRFDREVLVAVLLMGVVFWVAPGHLFSAQFVDMRIPLAAYLLLAASTEIKVADNRAHLATAAALLALIGFRSAAVARDWSTIEPVQRQIAAAFRCLAPGSVLFAAETNPVMLADWPPLGHFASIAEITNRAFVPATWAHPAQQPIGVKPAYAELYAFQTPNSRMIVEAQGLQEFSAEIRSLMASRRATGRDDFGGNVYLLFMFPERLGYPRIGDAGVVAEGKLFTLYRLFPGANERLEPNVPDAVECGFN